MAYSNIAWEIYEQLESKITANIKDVSVSSVYRFPDTENVMNYLGKYSRACLAHLENDEFIDKSGGSSTVNRYYVFALKPVVKYVNGSQQDIMDLSEQIKYFLQLNAVNGTYWQDLQVSNIDYPEAEAESNIKESNMNVRIYRDG